MRLVVAPATFDTPRMYAEVWASFGLARHFHTVMADPSLMVYMMVSIMRNAMM